MKLIIHFAFFSFCIACTENVKHDAANIIVAAAQTAEYSLVKPTNKEKINDGDLIFQTLSS